MNELSWLIYLADMCNTLGGWMIFFAILSFVAAAACVIVMLHGEEKAVRYSFWIVPVAMLLITISVLIPSRDTVLAIAASEVGEKVLATPQAQRVGEALMNWIEKQSEEETSNAKDH